MAVVKAGLWNDRQSLPLPLRQRQEVQEVLLANLREGNLT